MHKHKYMYTHALQVNVTITHTIPLIAAYWQKRKVLNTVLSEICNGWATCFHCNWPNPTHINSLSCWRRLNVQDWCKLWWRLNPVLGGCTTYFAQCMDVDYLMRTVFVEVVQSVLHIVHGCRLSDEGRQKPHLWRLCNPFYTLCMDVDSLTRNVFVEVVLPILHIVYGCWLSDEDRQ